MQFTSSLFKSTFARFRKSLNTRGLELNLNSAQDVWGQMLFGKNFSAAVASLNRHGSLRSKFISPDTIRAHLKVRSRDVEPRVACAIFVEAVNADLEQLSPGVYEIASVLAKVPGSCVTSIFHDDLGLGVLRANQPGYIPAGTLGFVEKQEGDFSWIRNNSEIAVELIEAAAGITHEESTKIFIANSIESDRKADDAFLKFFGRQIDIVSNTLTEVVLDTWDIADQSEWLVDYDELRNEIEEVFDELSSQEAWVNTDCNAAVTVIDHLTARVRQTMKWLGDGPDTSLTPTQALEYEIALAMKKYLHATGNG